MMHHLDAVPVELGDSRTTAAFWYNLASIPLGIDVKLTEQESRLPRAAGRSRVSTRLDTHPRPCLSISILKGKGVLFC